MIGILYLCWQQSTICLANLNKILEGKFCFNENAHQYKHINTLYFIEIENRMLSVVCLFYLKVVSDSIKDFVGITQMLRNFIHS